MKGVFDAEHNKPSILVTGSARLNVFRKGGDSLAGRFFHYRLHPFTVKELAGQIEPKLALERILKLGGFPEPFLQDNLDFSRRWRRGHLDVILREDLLDLEKVRDIKSIELLIELLLGRVGSTVSVSSLANDLQVSSHTVKHWLEILENLYVIFPVRPYSKNISRSFLKESKYYFYDTGAVAEAQNNVGAILENAVACGLLRELHFHEDTTGQKTQLHFLRDKDKHEVDFLAVVHNKPVQMIEVKYSDDQFSSHLHYFKKFFPVIDAVQVVHQLNRSKSTLELRMMSASEYLARLSF